jgi:hypothetical protein
VNPSEKRASLRSSRRELQWLCHCNPGAGDRIRTGDIDLGKVALYQLSYSRPIGTFSFSTGNTPGVKRCCHPIGIKGVINLLQSLYDMLCYILVGRLQRFLL